jgi:cobyrinic acid a,c-diamide synthase
MTGLRIRGHEFHYSTLQPQEALSAYAGRLFDAQGRDRGPDGITIDGHVIALYTHLHFAEPSACATGVGAGGRETNSLFPRQLNDRPQMQVVPIMSPVP